MHLDLDLHSYQAVYEVNDLRINKSEVTRSLSQRDIRSISQRIL